MAEPSLKKQLISCVVTLFLTAVFLCASITTFSWFASSQNVTANGLNVCPDTSFSDSQVRMCPVTAISGDNGNEYEFLSDKPVNSLPKFDKYNIDVSEYERAVVLVVSFTAAATKIDLSLSTSTLFNESEITGGKTDDYLSNVVSFATVGEVRSTEGSTVKTAVAGSKDTKESSAAEFPAISNTPA
ncbi:MAG: hypothetical protein SPH68_00220 [Candidatus Borkfalkiaceae bacterium]|nr:hypothetical protein [Clostridia bacterium]MDY6222573.1 hypothetical protein [Christensenellaceae bacterium]